MAPVRKKAKLAVEELFARKPDATLDELLEAAKKADSRFGSPPKRSFNARYVLPLKRSAAAAERRKKKTAKKASVGRPRMKATVRKRRPGRPRKKTTKKRGPGRPRKKTAAKRGPGRPRKKAAAKRGPGRPRKKTAARRGPGRPPGITAAKFAVVKRMILSRDRQLLIAAANPLKAYEVAYDIDAFVENLVKTIESS